MVQQLAIKVMKVTMIITKKRHLNLKEIFNRLLLNLEKNKKFYSTWSLEQSLVLDLAQLLIQTLPMEVQMLKINNQRTQQAPF